MSDLNPYADPACPICHGRGFIYGESMLDGGRYCECTLDGMRLDNMNRIWESLPEALNIPQFREDPKLARFANKSVWITAPVKLFKAHLKALAYNKPTIWHARVRTDAELLDAWFGTAKAQGVKFFDLEVEQSTLRAIDIRDLVEPPDLCIIMMGVKKLPNKEAPGSLAEAISYRSHLEKPTWVVDQPSQPLDGNHRYFSDEVERIMRRWPHVTLMGDKVHVQNDDTPKPVVSEAVHDLSSILADPEDEVEESEDYTPPAPSETKSFLDRLSVESSPKKKGGKRRR